MTAYWGMASFTSAVSLLTAAPAGCTISDISFILLQINLHQSIKSCKCGENSKALIFELAIVIMPLPYVNAEVKFRVCS